MLTKLNDIAHANCWAEIDLSALAHNVSALRSMGPEVIAVLKADAYGHGVKIVARELYDQSIRNFGVATALEGAELRGLIGNDSSVFVMTATVPADSALIAEHQFTPFVCSELALRALAEAAAPGRPISIHIEIDTGIGRAGVSPALFPGLLNHALSLEMIKVTGVCTHFTSGENADDANSQYKIFKKCLDQIPFPVREALTIHASNSPGILNVPDAHFNLIRPGLLLYGISPVPDSNPCLPNAKALMPVLTLKAKVILARKLPAGTPISYGRTYVLDHPATIGTIGIGYGDGYSRRHSNIGQVILPNGSLAPIRGRVCMDQLCVEIPDGDGITEGDIVTLVGGSGDNVLRAADIAGLIDATPHEITTCITSRVPRIAVRS